MLVSMFSALRAASSPRLASVGTLMLALVPSLSTRWAAGAYADMPQAAMLAGVVAACLNPGRQRPAVAHRGPDGGQGGGHHPRGRWPAPASSSSGCSRGRGAFSRGSAAKRGTSPSWPCLVGLRLAYLRWSRAPDVVYGPFDAAHLRMAIGRIPHVARLCVHELAQLPEVGAALARVSRGGDRADRCAAAPGRNRWRSRPRSPRWCSPCPFCSPRGRSSFTSRRRTFDCSRSLRPRPSR